MRRIIMLLPLVAVLSTASSAAERKYRDENITDEEVREIQSVVAGVKPGAIVHIGAVTEGCICEDGPGCTHEVRLVAYQPRRSTGLRLSRMEGRWIVGPLQAWELEVAGLLAEQRAMTYQWGTPAYRKWRYDFILRQQALFEARPLCPGEPRDPWSRYRPLRWFAAAPLSQ